MQDDDDDDEDDFVDDENAGFEPLNMLRKMVDDDDEDSGDEDEVNEVDDYVDSDEEEPRASTRISKGKTSSSSNTHAKKDKKASSDKKQEISVTDASSHSLAGPSTSIKSPPNFSKVETSLPLDELARRYPLYYEALTSSRSAMGVKDETIVNNTDSSSSNSSSSSGSVNQSTSDSTMCAGSSSTDGLAARCFEVTITAGQMLYIPAGWFHEVRSTGGGSEGHLALNYWFHPPDGSSFEKPYSSDFWPDDWKKRNMK